MPKEFKYKAFISYSHKDEKWAGWLHRSLEGYRTPGRLVGEAGHHGPVPARLSPIFRDRDELASSADLSEKINSALEDSENLIVICSPEAAASIWVNKEIEAFKQMGRSANIFCMIVAGDPSQTGLDGDCFPPALRQTYDDAGELVEGPAEPIAADLRKAADGRTLAKIKILAGLLGVGLDELRQRETVRRQRRMMMITAGSVAAAVVTIFLAINATLARNEAEQRREQAEDLLGFMVGDLRTSLTPIGRLDLLEDVADRAMEYLGTVDVNTLTDAELLRQAQVLTQLGEIRLEQLEYEEALASFTEAYNRSAVLQQLAPEDGERLFNRGQAEYWVGYVHYTTGSLQEATNWMARYRDTSVQLVALEPDNDVYKRELGYAHHNMAVMADSRGDQEAAREGYEFLLRVLEDLAARDSSTTLQLDIANSVSWLGNLEWESGDVQEALSFHERAHQIVDRVYQADPTNSVVMERLAVAARRAAELRAQTDDIEGALKLTEESIALFENQASKDASNAESVKQLASSRMLYAQLLIRIAQWSEAAGHVEWAIETLTELNSNRTTDYMSYSTLATAHYLSAQKQFHEGAVEMALTDTASAFRLLDDIANAERITNPTKVLRARLLMANYHYYLALKDEEEALASLGLLYSALEQEVEASTFPELLELWARVLYLKDRPDEARDVVAQLQARSFTPTVPWP